MSDWPRKRCRSCGAVVIWAKTAAAGEPMPVDLEPHQHGNLLLWKPPGETQPLAHVVEVKDPDQLSLITGEAPEPHYQPHWSSCPQAGAWRRA